MLAIKLWHEEQGGGGGGAAAARKLVAGLVSEQRWCLQAVEVENKMRGLRCVHGMFRAGCLSAASEACQHL